MFLYVLTSRVSTCTENAIDNSTIIFCTFKQWSTCMYINVMYICIMVFFVQLHCTPSALGIFCKLVSENILGDICYFFLCSVFFFCKNFGIHFKFNASTMNLLWQKCLYICLHNCTVHFHVIIHICVFCYIPYFVIPTVVSHLFKCI